MSYNQLLQANNADLQMLLSAINALSTGEQVIANSESENAIISRTINGVYSNSRITNLRLRAFNRCIALTGVYLPNVSTIGNYAFAVCRSLSTVDLPSAMSIPNGAFINCQSLATVDFPNVTQIGPSAFSGCVGLSRLYLRAPTMCTLENSDAFNSTPFAGFSDYFSGTPCIYVPASLITSYQAATNWTYFSSYFGSIEDSEKELISFMTIGGHSGTYQAKTGMTWSEWVESEYNIDQFSLTGETIRNPQGWLVYTYDGQTVIQPSDYINSNYTYYVEERA